MAVSVGLIDIMSFFEDICQYLMKRKHSHGY